MLSDFDADADGAPVPVAPLPDEFTVVTVRFRSATKAMEIPMIGAKVPLVFVMRACSVEL